MKDVVFVTGGTGNVGSELVRLLSRQPDVIVRAGARDPRAASSERLRAMGSNVDVVTFDVERPESLAPALRNVTRVYILPPFVEDMSGWHRRVVDVITDTPSVQYVVKHSVAGARASTPESIPSVVPRLHFEGEQMVAGSGKHWSVIRPTIFAQHLTTMPWVYKRGDSEFYMPIGEGRAFFLDARDIASMAAYLLLAADPAPYFGKAFDLTGPTAIGGSDMASTLSKIAGRTIQWIDSSPDEFRERMEASGSTPWNTEQALNVYADTKQGWLGRARGDDLSRIAGLPSRTFEEFAQDHVAHFHLR